MIFSKSFGYSLRGILFIGLKNGQTVQLDEMAEALGVPRHFMAKLMKQLVQHKILSSVRGPAGGFSLYESTLLRPLIDVYRITDHPEDLEQCVLSRGPCNSQHPCQLHDKILPLKEPLNKLLYDTTIGELLTGSKENLLHGLTAVLP